MKKVVVLSLGGSLIIPDNVDFNFLTKFKQIIKKHIGKYKFVIICGGGSIARKYIYALRKAGKSDYLQSLSGISATRMNARFMSYFFDIDPEKGIPHDMKNVKGLLNKNNIIFCGALRYAPKQTSDSTSAQLAAYLKTDFINLTNVPGLFTDNPLINKKAKFIPKASWQDLYNRANKRKFKPGQHFVIDQHATKIILEHKIKTYILGKNLNNLDNLLSGRKFVGSVIGG